MDYALALHRFHFAFTVTFHYLFVQLTLGMALLIFILKTLYMKTGDEHYNDAARFWARIFAINFALGVVTGIPMEFQFGTNWSRFSKAAGGVIGHTLGMEGLYSFFLESTFLGLLIYGEQILGRIGHWFAAMAVWLGSWLSGYFIVATDAWMQNPVGYTRGPNGEIILNSWADLLFQEWTFWQYSHTIIAGVVTGSFVMAALGAYYLLLKRDVPYARTFVSVGVTVGFAATILVAFPTGDNQGRLVAHNQPAALASMEGLFESESGAPIVLIGQPDLNKRKIDNPITIPNMLSFLTYRRWNAEVRGLDQIPRDQWPDNIPLLFYSFHLMVGIGTLMTGLMALSAIQLVRGKLFDTKLLLWGLLLFFPLPYIANTAGWMTAELGRQPWLIHGIMRTSEGTSPMISSGNALFTLLGFMGMYAVLLMLGLLLIWREIDHGPSAPTAAH